MTDPVLAATVILGREAEAGFEVLVMQRPARGSFANAWVFPGGRIDDDDAPGEDEQTRARVGAVREVHEEVGLIVDPEALVPLSRWIPPVELKRRFDTHFFLAMAPEGDVVPSPDEVVDWKWSTPARVLDAHARGIATLAPPTFVTLTLLRSHGAYADAVAAAREAGAEEFRTKGLPEHGLVSSGPHHLHTSALPWRYEYRDEQGS